MAKRSVIYVFTRDENHPGRVPDQNQRQKQSMTAAVGMLVNWAAVAGRSWQPVHEREDLLIAQLGYQEGDEQAVGDDLNERCDRLGFSRQTLTDAQAEKYRSP
ncbi:hypothetical protein [Acidovorax sp. Root217]|uniref:hypothetical protein n=1 Tax=Acidovorax sp. Root217 TaxID=1736492 RepID=UPI000AA4D2F3|nr:hypothetical protein [Acidovorax sp. Root217]